MAEGKVYITGASGRLGRSVFAKIPGAIPLVRKSSGLKAEVVTDFSAGSLANALKDADAVVHIAGSVDTVDKKRLYTANVELTRRIAEAAPGDCRIIFAGSVSVYGKKLAKIPADESTPVSPDSYYAKSKYEAEGIAAARPEHVILRIGTLYGPQFEDYFRVLDAIRKGKMRIIGDGKNRIPFVHVDDVAGVFRAALSRGKGVYVVAGEPLTQQRIYEIAAEGLGVEPPKKHMGRRMAMLLAGFGELRYRLGGRKPSMTSEHISVLAYDRAFDCSKAKRELGFSPRPLDDGIREMVRELRGRER